MDLREMGWCGMDCTDLAKDTDRHMVMNLQVP
jgi:hypothetical protein